jgi:hypothetical protein
MAVADGLHALLIGIDDYPASPLSGCVNDVLAVHDWLVARAKLPEERITRLIAGSGRAATDRPPTLANIRDGLAALAQLGEGCRAFIYYAGHGTQQVRDTPSARLSREALVPVDAWPQDGRPARLLWDAELNTLLRAIAQSRAHVTCVLDCCHSAGAFRAPPSFGAATVLDAGASRSVDVPGQDEPPADAAHGPRGLIAAAAPGGWAQVVACEASELAREAGVGDAGERYGLLTRALLQALRAVPEHRAHEVLWSEIWYGIVDRVTGWNPRQHPRQAEAWSRPVLGGPPATGDVGIRITRGTATEYVVHAGTIAGIAEGSELAVYPADPAAFPPIGSPADLAARRGVVQVTAARRATSDARAVGASFDPPTGARARVIGDAPTVRLAVRADPGDALVAGALAAAGDRMRAATATDGDVWVARRDDGALVLGDDCYTSLAPGDPRTLLELPDPTAGELAAALEHYRRYCEPVRMARRCRDLSSALQIEVLDCSDLKRLAALAAAGALQDPDLPPVRSTTDPLPIVQDDQRFCVRVANTSTRELVVVGLLCCTSDGQVELFGEELVPALGRTTYWRDGQLGNPFVGWLPPGRARVYERLIAIGTTVAGTSFAALRLARGFEAALRSAGARALTRGPGDDLPPRPPERWTGTICEIVFERSARDRPVPLTAGGR